ncbi:MAG: hypothetical protein HY393_00595 [Candidatus Diapherotrites archaeon]|nr:hypothetical protein [Candidatus Diapherotrites archaeon]
MTVLLLKRFSAPKSTAIFSLFPLALFGLGFVLRLTAEPALIDIGFFFTEFSYLFIYVLFTLSLVLGQVKYWGISSKPHKTR